MSIEGGKPPFKSGLKGPEGEFHEKKSIEDITIEPLRKRRASEKNTPESNPALQNQLSPDVLKGLSQDYDRYTNEEIEKHLESERKRYPDN